jgi:hypothetical protein
MSIFDALEDIGDFINDTTENLRTPLRKIRLSIAGAAAGVIFHL